MENPVEVPSSEAAGDNVNHVGVNVMTDSMNDTAVADYPVAEKKACNEQSSQVMSSSNVAFDVAPKAYILILSHSNRCGARA
jgi:hypothetical protein